MMLSRAEPSRAQLLRPVPPLSRRSFYCLPIRSTTFFITWASC
jgi:hypothetical protein